MKRPERIKNEALWIKHCTQIRARAEDFLAGRIDIFEAASAIRFLARQTFAEPDPDLTIFQRIDDDIGSLPVGSVRAYWAPHALSKADVQISAIRDEWREPAFEAARRLVEKYKWSLEARAAFRDAGGSI